MVDLKTLKQLIKLMVDNDLTELDIEAEGGPVKIKRNSQGTVTHVVPSGIAAPAPMPAAPAPAAPVAVSAAPQAAPADSGVTIDSPMVGTFYAASSPDAKAFANVGDRVDEDTVVCIIEAMKVFNEIKAEASGTIEKVLVENGQAVEFGQPLFTIKPD
jgi:acetyl-CoA carboxylase biotin carboxyl carrier protein